MDSPLLLVLALANVILLIIVLRRPTGSADVAASLATLQAKMEALGERMQALEMQQSNSVVPSVARAEAHTKGLLDAAAAIHSELSAAQRTLAELQAQAEVAQRTAESVRRLEMILAGTQTRGAAGENILELVFAKLPPEWQVRNFRVGNRVVEFGLRLPNNLVLPIDSKWTATHLVERLAACDDPGEQQRLKAQIERAVLEKAREVTKYLDPSLTVNFGVAVLPDAVYELCAGVHGEVFRLNVVLICQSMFVPYLLLVFQTVLRTSQNVDLEKLQQYLTTAEQSATAIQSELEGRFARALTMLENARSDLSVHLSKIRGSLTGMQVSAGPQQAALASPSADGITPAGD